jgi:hypothetical protein
MAVRWPPCDVTPPESAALLGRSVVGCILPCAPGKPSAAETEPNALQARSGLRPRKPGRLRGRRVLRDRCSARGCQVRPGRVAPAGQLGRRECGELTSRVLDRRYTPATADSGRAAAARGWPSSWDARPRCATPDSRGRGTTFRSRRSDNPLFPGLAWVVEAEQRVRLGLADLQSRMQTSTVKRPSASLRTLPQTRVRAEYTAPGTLAEVWNDSQRGSR